MKKNIILTEEERKFAHFLDIDPNKITKKEYNLIQKILQMIIQTIIEYYKPISEPLNTKKITIMHVRHLTDSNVIRLQVWKYYINEFK